MKPRALPAGDGGPTFTFTAPPVTIVQAPPALVTNRNPEHVGLTRRDLLEVLRDMRRHPKHAAEVVSRGKIRGASPAAILAFLREQTSRGEQLVDTAANDGAEVDSAAGVLASIGYEQTPEAAPKRARGGR